MAGTIPASVLALAVVACATPTSIPVPACEPKSLPPGSLAMVKTLVQFQAEQRREDFEKQLEALLENRTTDGDVALASLLGVYLGEGPAEDIVCEAINRGPRIFPLVRGLRDCPPSTEMAPLPAGVVLTGPSLHDEVLRELAQGKTCNYED